MTEDEAKSKWCPFARVDSTAANRPNAGDNCDTGAGWPPCIASACLAWRRQITGREYSYSIDRRPEGDGWEAREAHMGGVEWIRYGGGFCGLAGRPE